MVAGDIHVRGDNISSTNATLLRGLRLSFTARVLSWKTRLPEKKDVPDIYYYSFFVLIVSVYKLNKQSVRSYHAEQTYNINFFYSIL